jgi:outer membrane lipoprotein-sorting protein
MRDISRLAPILPALLLTSCAHLYAGIVADKVAGDQLEIATYRGRFVERYPAPGYPDGEARVVREVTYAEPGLVRVEVVEPADRAGELLVYDGSTITMWWPTERFGIVIHGVEALAEDDYEELLAEDTIWSWKNYRFSYRGHDELLDRDVTVWNAVPKRDDPLRYPYRAWTDIEYSIPLVMEIMDAPDHLWYSMRFEELEFDCEVDRGLFDAPFPDDAVLVEWDLDDPGVPLDELRDGLNFELLLPPEDLPGGLALDRALQGRTGAPMAALLYRNEGRWLSVTETSHFGGMLELDTGIPVAIGGEPGALNLMGTFSSVSWYAGATAVTLIGNMPYPEMVAIAASLQPEEGQGAAGTVLAADSFRGRYVEEQAGAPTVVRDVVYAAPGKARVEVVSPRSRAGETFVYDGSSLVMWWPRHMFAVRIRGAGPPSTDQLVEALGDNAIWSLRHYDHAYLGSGPRGDREVDRWRLDPTDDQPYLFRQDVELDRVTSLPLAVEVRDEADAPWYAMRFEEVEFGEPVDDQTFSLRLPGNAVVFDWDLDDPGVPLDELQRRMNFRVLLPRELPDGLEVAKMIRGRHDLPMAAVLMEGDGYQLSLTQARNAGLPHGRGQGTPVELGDRTGYLNLMGSFTSIAWTQGNTALTLVGNLPYPEMIAIAASVDEPDDALVAALGIEPAS